MNLLVLIACLVAARFYSTASLWHHRSLLKAYTKQCLGYTSRIALSQAWLALPAFILPLIITVSLLNTMLMNAWHGLIAFAYCAVVLLFCLQPPPCTAQLQACQKAIASGELAHAQTLAETLFGSSFHTSDANALHSALRRELLMGTMAHVFAVVLWFMFLGPGGALILPALFALQSTLRDDTAEVALPSGLLKACDQAIYWLCWPVVRLLGLALALVGHFGHGFAFWTLHAAGKMPHEAFLGHIADASLKHHPDLAHQTTPEVADEEHLALIDLLNHALVLWLIVIGLVQVGGWLL